MVHLYLYLIADSIAFCYLYIHGIFLINATIFENLQKQNVDLINPLDNTRSKARRVGDPIQVQWSKHAEFSIFKLWESYVN